MSQHHVQAIAVVDRDSVLLVIRLHMFPDVDGGHCELATTGSPKQTMRLLTSTPKVPLSDARYSPTLDSSDSRVP